MQQLKYLIGTSDFDEIISEEAIFVDKTLFIKEFVEDGVKVATILRPRRFGKSTNLSMLKSFLSRGAEASDFDRFLIADEKEFVEEHCGRYPVVYLDFKDCDGKNWDKMYSMVWRQIQGMVERHRADLDHIDLARIFDLNDPRASIPADSSFVESTLSWLMKALHEKFKQRVIVLIDEYDAPLNKAANRGFYDEASLFFGSFYSQSFKSNPALKKACLMGIVEIRGAGILSGLNNMSLYPVSSVEYSSHFGFTEEEVKAVLSKSNHGMDFEEVLKMYNGYQIGTLKIINPWSMINCLKRKQLKFYWTGTSSSETLVSHVKPLKDTVMKWIPLLCKGERLKVAPLTTAVNYSIDNWSLKSIKHYLVLTGYLTYKEKNATEAEVWIPNEEVRQLWKSEISEILREKVTETTRAMLCSIFTDDRVEFDCIALHTIMKDLLPNVSHHDIAERVNTPLEYAYHLFFFGVFLCMSDGHANIQVESNRESGHGRFDIKILVTGKRCVIFEFKRASDERDLDRDAQRAYDQIVEKDYAHGVEEPVIGIGVAFHKKLMSKLHCKDINGNHH